MENHQLSMPDLENPDEACAWQNYMPTQNSNQMPMQTPISLSNAQNMPSTIPIIPHMNGANFLPNRQFINRAPLIMLQSHPAALAPDSFSTFNNNNPFNTAVVNTAPTTACFQPYVSGNPFCTTNILLVPQQIQNMQPAQHQSYGHNIDQSQQEQINQQEQQQPQQPQQFQQNQQHSMQTAQQQWQAQAQNELKTKLHSWTTEKQQQQEQLIQPQQKSGQQKADSIEPIKIQFPPVQWPIKRVTNQTFYHEGTGFGAPSSPKIDGCPQQAKTKPAQNSQSPGSNVSDKKSIIQKQQINLAPWNVKNKITHPPPATCRPTATNFVLPPPFPCSKQSRCPPTNTTPPPAHRNSIVTIDLTDSKSGDSNGSNVLATQVQLKKQKSKPNKENKNKNEKEKGKNSGNYKPSESRGKRGPHIRRTHDLPFFSGIGTLSKDVVSKIYMNAKCEPKADKESHLMSQFKLEMSKAYKEKYLPAVYLEEIKKENDLLKRETVTPFSLYACKNIEAARQVSKDRKSVSIIHVLLVWWNQTDKRPYNERATAMNRSLKTAENAKNTRNPKINKPDATGTASTPNIAIKNKLPSTSTNSKSDENIEAMAAPKTGSNNDASDDDIDDDDDEDRLFIASDCEPNDEDADDKDVSITLDIEDDWGKESNVSKLTPKIKQSTTNIENSEPLNLCLKDLQKSESEAMEMQMKKIDDSICGALNIESFSEPAANTNANPSPDTETVSLYVNQEQEQQQDEEKEEEGENASVSKVFEYSNVEKQTDSPDSSIEVKDFDQYSENYENCVLDFE